MSRVLDDNMTLSGLAHVYDCGEVRTTLGLAAFKTHKISSNFVIFRSLIFITRTFLR